MNLFRIAGIIEAHTGMSGKGQCLLVTSGNRKVGKLLWSDFLLFTATLTFCLQTIDRNTKSPDWQDLQAHQQVQEHPIWLIQYYAI